MVLLSCEKISKSFGANNVLSEVSFSINEGARIGIVGSNGSGKSTLLQLITGDLACDSGSIYLAKSLTIGYLRQNEAIKTTNTIWNELLSVYTHIFEMEKRIRFLEEQISRHTDMSSKEFQDLSVEYGSLLEKFADIEGYSYESHMKGVLAGLGFSSKEFDQPIWQLSGGEKTRVALVKLLLMKPNLLLLDEPTNHLDLNSVQWLENFLKDYPGTIILVSHDRYFLDSICDFILEIENQSANMYQGNYSQYYRKKQQRREIQLKEYELQQKEIRRQEEIIKRFRSFNREKSIRAAESRQRALHKIKPVDKPAFMKDIRMSFHSKKQSGRDVLRAEGLKMSFNNNVLFDQVSFYIEKGDRIGIIGPNGVGKTTLFRILLGQLKPISGTFQIGTGVDIGYYDQEQSSLNPDQTVIDEVWNSFPHLKETEIRNVLALFLFAGDDVYKTISQLSGGEKGRVMLSKLMLAGNNLMLLDEPTNHLDMPSKEVLEQALEDYDGTLLIISHDRYFLNKIVDRIFLFEKNGITEYLGNYDDFLEKRRNEEIMASLKEKAPVGMTKTGKQENKKKEREERQKRRAYQQLLENLEEKIQSLEETVKMLEEQLADPELYKDIDKMLTVQEKYNQTKASLDQAYQKWMDHQL